MEKEKKKAIHFHRKIKEK